MSKKIVMYIVTSLIVSIITTVGSFTCKDSSGPQRVTLVIQHPDGCFLVEPNPMAAGMSTGADMVSVPAGKNTFKFDCDGRLIEVVKDIQPGKFAITINPLATNDAPSTKDLGL